MPRALNIGLPQGLHFSWYLPFWKIFFETLGHNVMVSSRMNKTLLRSLQLTAENELCLPSKVYIAQCAQLKDLGAEIIFSPFYESPDERVCICPKFVMINDLAKAAVPGLPRFFSPSIVLDEDEEMFSLGSLRDDRTMELFLSDTEKAFTEAYKTAKGRWEGTRTPAPPSARGKKTVALMGHPYVLAENHLVPEITSLIASCGSNIISMRDISYGELRKYYDPGELLEPLHWICARKMAAFVNYLIQEKKAGGIIFISSFACVIDEVVDEITRRAAARAKVPYLFLPTDGHTSASNVSVRVEAFMDILT